jgi:hypothetical protein
MAAHEKPADPQPKKSLDAKLEEWPDERFWQEFNEFSIGTKWLETLKQVATRVIRPMYDRGLPPLRSSMASPYLYSTPIAEQTLREGPHMALGDGQQ